MKWINATLVLFPLVALLGCGVENSSLTQATENGNSVIAYDTIRGQTVAVEWFDGKEFVRGTDMMIPPRSTVKRVSARSEGVYIGNSNYPWPDSVIPCAFDVSVHDSIVIMSAIDAWNDSLKRYNANVRFKYVPVGYSGAKLTIGPGSCGSLAAACATLGSRGNGGTVVYYYDFGIGRLRHELGHVLGLAHEQNHPKIRDYVYVDGTPKDSSTCSDPISRWQTEYEATYYGDAPNQKSVMLYDGTTFINATGIPGDCDGASIKWKSNNMIVRPGTEISSGDVAAVVNLYSAAKTSAGVSKWPDGKAIMVRLHAGAGVDSTKLDMKALRIAITEAAARWISNIDPTQNAISVGVTNSIGDVTIELVAPNGRSDNFSYECNPSDPRYSCHVVIPAYNVGSDPAAKPRNLMNVIYRSNVLQAVMGNVLGDVVGNVGAATYVDQDFTQKECLPSDAEVSQFRATYGSSANFAPLIEKQAVYGATVSQMANDVAHPILYTDWNSASAQGSEACHYKVLARLPLSGKYADTYRLRLFELDSEANAGGPRETAENGYAYWSDISTNFASSMIGTCVQGAVPSVVSEKNAMNVSLFKNSNFISGKMVPIVSANFGSTSDYPNKAWYVWTAASGDCRAVIGYGVRPY